MKKILILLFAISINSLAADPNFPDGRYLLISSERNEKINVAPCDITTNKEGTFVSFLIQNPSNHLNPIRIFTEGDKFYFAITPADYAPGADKTDLTATIYKGDISNGALSGKSVWISGGTPVTNAFRLYKQ